MSEDALAALLAWQRHEGGCVQATCSICTERTIGRLIAAGVVILPPDHPLRTGEPSEAMDIAARNAAQNAALFTRGDLAQQETRYAIALNAAYSGLRAALAVLREGS